MFVRDRPTMVIELAPYILEEAGHSLDELLDLLTEFGYRLHRLGTKHPLPMDRATLRRLIPKAGGINAVATVSHDQAPRTQ
jgi:hypothetical protein